MDPVTMFTCAIVVAIACGAIVAVLVVAFVMQALQSRRYRRRAVNAERSLALRSGADRVREDRHRDVKATALATTRARGTGDMTLAQHIATAPDVTALLPSAEHDPRATVELVSYRNPTKGELVAWRNGGKQQ